MIKAVIFDLDDTVIPTEAIYYELENLVLKRMGRPPQSREIHKKTWEMRPRDAISLRSPGTDWETYQEQLVIAFAEYEQSGRINAISPAMYQALDRLKELGKAVHVITARTRDRVAPLLKEGHPLHERVEDFYYRETSRFRKPDPRVFDELLTAHGLTPNECVYVGDSLLDAQAAQRAGVHFIACLESGLRTRADFEPYTVAGFIERCADIPGAVQQLDR